MRNSFKTLKSRSIYPILYSKTVGVNLMLDRVSRGKIVLLGLILFGAASVWLTGLNEYLTFENLKGNRDILRSYVESHYIPSVIVFIAAVVSTAFFVPGAIAVTLVGGFLFGVLLGTLYLLAGATMGASLAFLSARYVLGNWVQRRYEEQLRIFNREMARHGHNYLITFRIVPVMPFFLVNYLAGITRMPIGRFMWTTAVGMLPGSVVYSFAGRELRGIESPDDIMSPKLLSALILLALFALLPVLLRLSKWVKGRVD